MAPVVEVFPVVVEDVQPALVRNKFERVRPFFGINKSNSNRIWSSRELIILSDSNLWCVWGSWCAVACFHTRTDTQHGHSTAQIHTAQSNSSFIISVVVSSMIRDNMYLYFP